MLKELLDRANELRSQSTKPVGSASSSKIARQKKIEMMNALEMQRRKSIEENRKALERQIAANQAAMQVAKQQAKPSQQQAQPSGQQAQPQGLLNLGPGGR